MTTFADHNQTDITDVRGCIDAPYDDYTHRLHAIYDYALSVYNGKTPYNQSRLGALLAAFQPFTDNQNDFDTSTQLAILWAEHDAQQNLAPTIATGKASGFRAAKR